MVSDHKHQTPSLLPYSVCLEARQRMGNWALPFEGKIEEFEVTVTTKMYTKES